MDASPLLTRYQKRVYAFARTIVSCDAEAADVTQEVLLKVWRSGANVPEDRQQAWIYRVTRNACLDALRKRQSRRQWSEASARLEDHPGDSLAPDAELMQGDLRACLETAISRLDEPFRSLVVLRDLHDLSYDEIAETLELPLTTVKVYLHRARRRLRESCRDVLQHHVEHALPSES
ncbi:sigma-70 family RNA polymerase sigma factor [soil metagenome]